MTHEELLNELQAAGLLIEWRIEDGKVTAADFNPSLSVVEAWERWSRVSPPARALMLQMLIFAFDTGREYVT
jgi:hypothetical protein